MKTGDRWEEYRAALRAMVSELPPRRREAALRLLVAKLREFYALAGMEEPPWLAGFEEKG